MELLDSRRLTGPNLAWDHPGALLEVRFDDDAVFDLWRAEVGEIRSELGLPDMGTTIKRRRDEAWLVVGGPVDQLYGLIEASEEAWRRALCRFEGTDPGPLQLDTARAELAEERHPGVIALQQAAKQQGVTFLWDDDEISLGMGTGSRTWPREQTPSPTDVNWDAFHDVPTAVVTGTNGKSTTVRLLAAMATAWGRTYGNTSTDYVRVNDDILDTGDYSGPGGARTAVRDRRVELALLETARGGLLRRGCGLNRADVAAVLNVAEDHMGQYGIHSVEDLIEAKLIVRRLVSEDGVLVLNADDEGLVRASAQFPDQTMAWFSIAELDEGANGAFVKDGRIRLRIEGTEEDVAAVSDVPIALGGAAAYNVANAVAATLIAHLVGMPLEAIRAGLTGFESSFDANPGRSNWFDMGGFKVLLDYAHNPHGLHAILQTTRAVGADRRVMVLSTAGDRTEKEIRQLADMAAKDGVDVILPSNCVGYERELGDMGVPRILADQLQQHGIDAPMYASELEGVKAAFAQARPGDSLILLVKGERNATLEFIQQEMARRS